MGLFLTSLSVHIGVSFFTAVCPKFSLHVLNVQTGYRVSEQVKPNKEMHPVSLDVFLSSYNF